MNDQRIWRRSFNLFGPLSLSTMAGMSIGGALFLLASVWAIARSWRDWGKEALREAWANPYGAATAFFFLACFLSLFMAWIYPPAGTEGAPAGFRELKKFHHFLYPPIIAIALLRTSDTIERHPFWKFWAGMGVFCFVLGVLQFFARDLFPEAWLGHRFFRGAGGSGRFHAQGLMFFHLSFASCMTFVAAAGLARFLWPLPFDQGKKRWLWLLVGIAGVGAVYFSYSRIGLVGLIVLIATLGFLKSPKGGFAALVACCALGAVLYTTVPSLHQRFAEAASYNSERYIMWQTAWEMFKERPITGLGFGRSSSLSAIYAERMLGHKASFTSHAHNNILEILGSVGLFGLLAYLAWWGAAFLFAWRSFREAREGERWLPAAALAAFVAFQVNGLTQVNFWDGKSQHTMMLMVGVALACELRRRRRKAGWQEA